MRSLFAATLFIKAGLLQPAAAAATIQEIVYWCLHSGQADTSPVEQLGYPGCALVAAGTFFGGQPDLATKDQSEAAWMGAGAACQPPPVRDLAVRYLQACVCHNPTDIKTIENNQSTAVQLLRESFKARFPSPPAPPCAP